jgi:septal ring factor EnvC (AmiA/AmiB activator)
MTEEEWAELHPAPPAPEPTKEEKLVMLDAQYNADKADLLTAYQTAMLYGDTDTMDSLKSDLQALDDQYDEDYERIVGEG